MAEHRLMAAAYDRVMSVVERGGLGERRRRLLARAWGRVLEIGAGTGANLAHYRDAAEVVALEPDLAMADRLRAKVGRAAVPVEVVVDDAQHLPFPDHSFDTVVSTLVLCTVRDPGRALAEARRVLAPGGRLLFLEHVSGTGWTARTQRLLGPLWQRVAGGCHLDRDTVRAIKDAGFVIDDLERFPMPKAPAFVRPAIMGVAYP